MNKTRIKNDVYPTEQGIIVKLAELMPEVFECNTYFEPCAGAGDLVGAIAKHIKPTATILTGELFSGDRKYDFPQFDASKKESWGRVTQPVEAVITNPPFSDVAAIAHQSWDKTSRYLVLIMRLTFLEQCMSRRDFLTATQDHLVMIAPINPRPRFRSDTLGTDNVTCVVIVWDKLHSWRSLNMRSPYQMISDWR